MNELSQLTYEQQSFIEIMEVMDKRLNDRGAQWRHVFKSLVLLDYMLHAGSENVVLYFQENIYIIKTLREFVYVSDEGRDEGSNVRQKAKEITALLMDDARIREQRKARSNMRDRMSGNPGRRRDDSDSEDEVRMRRRGDRDASRNARKQQETGEEDDEMSRAIAESKRSAAKDAERARRSKQQNDDLEEAMRLSREEEERRKRMLAGNNGSLFDPDNPDASAAGRSAWDNLIDMSDSQPQQQPQFQQPMITGFPTTQFQSFNPYAAQQEEMMRQQQMAEMQRQMQLQAEQEAYNQMLQQQAYQQQQLVYQQQLQQQQQQMQQPAPLVPQHTSIGSNNPFAQFSKPASPPPMPVTQAPALAQRPASTQLAASARPAKDDGKHAHLASLLGNRDDGIDSFGNTNLAKYGHNATNRLQVQQTGSNLFHRGRQQNNEQPLFEL